MTRALLAGLLVLGGAVDARAQGLVRPPPSAEARDEAERAAPPPEAAPPELRRFVEAHYPDAALAAGLEAEVVLRLDLDAAGAVTAVEVVEPAGHGFDEAAAAAARRFEFAPARLGDTPIASRILYRYRFELRAAGGEGAGPGPEAEPARLAASGRVTDLDGAPVAGARVIARPVAGGDPVEASSDETGAFTLALPRDRGEVELRVEASGYVTYEAGETVTIDGRQALTFRLEREGARYETVVRARRPGQQLTTRSVGRAEVGRVPGASGDPIRVIQNLPGMNRTPLGLGLLIVRGTAPGDTDVLLESVDIPLLYHFGGITSVINPRLIEAIDFMPGNPPARYGGGHGGVIEVRLRELQQEPFVGWHGELSIDIIDAQLQLEGPIVDGLSFAVAGRRSYVDAVAGLASGLFDGIELTTAPAYWDWQAVLQWRPSSRHLLRVIGFGSDDRLRLVSRQARDQGPVVTGAISNQSTFNGALLQYRYRPEGPVAVDVTASGGQAITRASAGDLADIDIERVGFELRPEVTLRAGRWGRFLFGGRLTVEDVSARLTLPDLNAEGCALDVVTRPWQQETRIGGQIYGEAQLQPVEALRLTAGLHADVDGARGTVVVEPRFWLRYEVAEGTAIEGGVGAFHQPPGVLQSDPFFGNPALGTERSVQYGLGLEQRIWGPLTLTVNGFYKALDRLGAPSDAVTERDGQTVPLRYDDVGEGRIYGLELLLRAEPTERFFGWLSYTLMRSERRDGPQEPWELFSFDQTHILTLVAGVTLPRGWEIGLRFQLASGRPTTPIVGSIYEAECDTYQGVPGQAGSVRLPLSHQLDLRVEKTWTIRSLVRLSLYLDVQNVYYHANVEAYSYAFDYSRRYAVTGLPILPSIGIEAEF